MYADLASGAVTVRRATPGVTATIDLDNPPVVAGSVVVATFHTHPNPSAEGWDSGPSSDDTHSALVLGVPCLVRTDDGTYTTGPDSRHGGLGGPPGFPA